MTSFSQMHNDHLDPDRHNSQEEPPCETCKWDNGSECILRVDCRYEEKPGLVKAAVSQMATQVGGDHYQGAIQPIQFIHANGLPFLEGCIVKRIYRWRKKGGLQDLLKARHEIDLLIELEGLK